MTPRQRERLEQHVSKLIGRRIRALRLKANLSQEQLARKIGMSYQQVQKYENGVNRIAAVTLLAVSEALGVPCISFLEV